MSLVTFKLTGSEGGPDLPFDLAVTMTLAYNNLIKITTQKYLMVSAPCSICQTLDQHDLFIDILAMHPKM
jgi:hypothetical protein